jgi:hypothetical protein
MFLVGDFGAKKKMRNYSFKDIYNNVALVLTLENLTPMIYF